MTACRGREATMSPYVGADPRTHLDYSGADSIFIAYGLFNEALTRRTWLSATDIRHLDRTPSVGIIANTCGGVASREAWRRFACFDFRLRGWWGNRLDRSKEGMEMASLVKEVEIETSPHAVWEAVADFAALHVRLMPGLGIGLQMEGNCRILTFPSGQVLREVLVGCDHRNRRLAYAIEDARFTHHNASLQVFDAGNGAARLVWTVDVLPDDVAPAMSGRLDAGLATMKATLSR